LREVSVLVVLHYYPIQAYEYWLYVSKVETGFLFQSITRYGIIKNRVKCIGLKPKNYFGHSLRAGLVTSPEQTFANCGENPSPNLLQKFCHSFTKST
jgi:hypothetical protein